MIFGIIFDNDCGNDEDNENDDSDDDGDDDGNADGDLKRHKTMLNGSNNQMDQIDLEWLRIS